MGTDGINWLACCLSLAIGIGIGVLIAELFARGGE
jgi:uncharacterized membrane-anchored protein YhcB (DUF1043 family)